MRENMGLYRGKRLKDGVWIEGSLLVYPDGACFICCLSDDPDVLDKFLVDPDTIGQYIGLTDKNGKGIFEGDVVTQYTNGSRGVIEWENEDAMFAATFDLDDVPVLYNFDCIWGHECEVIGNVHDNPELIGGNNNG